MLLPKHDSIRSSAEPHSMHPAERGPRIFRRPRLADPVSIGILMGGTNVVGSLVKKGGVVTASTKFTWEEFKERFQLRELQGQVLPFVDYLGRQVADLLAANDVAPEHISEVILSIAAFVKKGRVSAPNIPLKLQATPIFGLVYDSFKGFLPQLRLRDLHLMNDGPAGARGEFLAPGGKLKSGTGIFIIWGTGVGMGAIKNGRVVPWINELGHRMIKHSERNGEMFNPKGPASFKLHTLKELRQMKLLLNDEYQVPDPSSGMVYLEHLLGGTWAAIRCVKFLHEEHLLGRLAQETQKLSQATGILKDRNGISEAELLDLSIYPEWHMGEWNHEAPSDQMALINRAIVSARRSGVHDLYSSTMRSYELRMYEEWGEALGVLHAAYPEYPIILGSGMAEARRDDPEFLGTVHRMTGLTKNEIDVSDINASLREPASIAPKR